MLRIELPPELRAYATESDESRYPILNASIEDSLLFTYRNLFRADLNAQLQGRFWTSQDISVAEEVVLEPYSHGGTTPFIPVNMPEDLGPFNGLDPYALTLANINTRSRFAQLGAEVSHLLTYPERILITNYARRPIRLPKDTPVCNLYYWSGEKLTGEALESAIGSRIVIEGEENEAWRKWYGNPRTNPNHELRGLEFFIDPKSRSFIPKSPKPMKIDAGAAHHHNRHSVNRYLKKAHPTSLKRLVIAETLAKLRLDESIHGICDKDVAFNRLPVGAYPNYDRQINSVIILGGNTDGTIRTEIWETTKTEFPPDTILMQFINA